MLRSSWMSTSTFRRTSWCLIGLIWFHDTESWNSILPRDLNNCIKRTSRTIGMPSITITTTCHKWSPFNVAFSASKSESSISKPSLSFRTTVLPAAKCCFPVVIWLPHCPPVICEAWIHGTPKPPWWKASWCYNPRLQSITQQYARPNAPRGNVQQHMGVYQA